MTAVAPPPVPLPAARRPLPPLEHGDHLTRTDFERRWAATPHVAKADLLATAEHAAFAAGVGGAPA